MFEIGAKLEGDQWNTSKNKQNKKQSNEIISKNEHRLVFTFEKRRGKPVTLAGRFYLSDKDKKEVLKLLKKKLACGGAVKDEWLELQGDVKEKAIEVLNADGWKFKNK